MKTVVIVVVMGCELHLLVVVCLVDVRRRAGALAMVNGQNEVTF